MSENYYFLKEEYLMAGTVISTNNTISGTIIRSGNSKGLVLTAQGKSTRTQATFYVKQPCLRVLKQDSESGLWVAKDDKDSILTGQKCADLIAKYLKANKERRMEKFKRDLVAIANSPVFTVDVRSLGGKDIKQRANEYLAGKVFGALDACPQTFTVGDTQYKLETIKVEKYMNVDEAFEVLSGTKMLGGGTKVDFVDESPSATRHFIDEATFKEAMDCLKEILKPTIQGNTLKICGVDCMSFVDAVDGLEGVEVGTTSFDVSKYSVF